MPLDFDPHAQLAKIMTLSELMTSCRQRAPIVIDRIDELLNIHWDGMSNMERMALLNMVMDRGFGKPRQHVVIHDPSEMTSTSSQTVKVYLPENSRENQYKDAKTIDVAA